MVDTFLACDSIYDLSNTDLRSLDFVINRFFMKLFKTTNMEIVQPCQTYFCFELPSVLLKINLEMSIVNIIDLDLVLP